jgi:hemoglobin
MTLQEHEVYSRIGESGFARLAAEFYRQIPADDLLGPMYPAADWVGAEARLRDFLIYRFGGPQTYIEERGHPRLRMRHAPFPITIAARDRWMQLMNHALVAAELPEDVAELLHNFFEHMATFLVNRPS